MLNPNNQNPSEDETRRLKSSQGRDSEGNIIAQNDPEPDEDDEDSQQDPQEEDDNLQKNQNEPVSKEKEQSNLNTINITKAVCFLLIIFDIGFAQYICMFREICDFQGIEMIEVYGNAVIIFLFITLFLILFTLYIVNSLDKTLIQLSKYLVLLWAVVQIVFCGLTFYQAGTNIKSDIQDKYDSLSQLSKEHYDNDVNKLVDINKENLTYTGIYHVICGVLLLVLFVMIILMENSQIFGTWRPRTQVINPGCEYKGNVIIEAKKKKKARILKDLQRKLNAKDLELGGGGQDLGLKHKLRNNSKELKKRMTNVEGTEDNHDKHLYEYQNPSKN